MARKHETLLQRFWRTYCSQNLGGGGRHSFADDLVLFVRDSQLKKKRKKKQPLTDSEHKVKPFLVKTAHISCWLLQSSSNVATVKPGLRDMIKVGKRKKKKKENTGEREYLNRKYLFFLYGPVIA